MNPSPNPFLQFLPITLLGTVFAAVSYFLAKEKGRKAALYCILGLVPLVNIFSAFYLLGARDLALNAKIDLLLARLPSGQTSVTGQLPPTQ